MIYEKEILARMALSFAMDEPGTMQAMTEALSGTAWLKPEQSAGLVKALRCACSADADALVEYQEQLLGRWSGERALGRGYTASVAKYEYRFHGDRYLDCRIESMSSTMVSNPYGGSAYMSGSGVSEESGLYVITKPGEIWWVTNRGRNYALTITRSGNALQMANERLWRIGL